MKTCKLTALALLTTLLTACGGGGSKGGNEYPSPQPTPIQTEQATPPTSGNNRSEPQSSTNAEQTTPTNTAKPTSEANNNPLPTTPAKKLDNGILVEQKNFAKGELKNEDVEFGSITGFNNNYSFSGAWVEPEKDPNIINVAGKRLALSATTKLGGLHGTILSQTVNSLFNAAEKRTNNVFYFGSETAEDKIASLKGKATYVGYATRYDNISKDLGNVGKATLTADFDTKKIQGELAMNGLRRNISLKETDIKGNGFTGRAVAGENSLFTTREGTYEGKFYGPNAEEVAGKAEFKGKDAVIGRLSDLDTSFSGKKQ